MKRFGLLGYRRMSSGADLAQADGTVNFESGGAELL